MSFASTEIIVKGRIPSKKNCRNVFVRGGKLFNIPSSKYKEWHKDASNQILLQKCKPINDISLIELRIYAPDKREADLSNKTESIMDLLVDNGIIKDDNWWIIGNLNLIFMGLDKENPRCEITIHTKEPNGKL